ncbi:MAG: ATP-binding protein [Chloroflexi bacterium]|nr:ATP-binding protein [Chloroflexota bacterium]
MRNPYTPFTPAIENFFGREDILAVFASRLRPGSDAYIDARHLLLVGDGGIGKSSLIQRMKRDALECGRSVDLIDLDMCNYAFDPADLLRDLRLKTPQSSHAESRIKKKLGLAPHASTREVVPRLLKGFANNVQVGFPPSIQIAPAAILSNTYHVRSVKKQLISWRNELLQLVRESSKMVIVFLDQIGILLGMPGGLLVATTLAELMQEATARHFGNLLLVMAIRPDQKGMLEHQFRQEIFDPHYAARLPLYPLGLETARRAISEPARSQGLELSSELVDELLRCCGDHPYFLQIACHRLWQYLQDTRLLNQCRVSLGAGEVESIVRAGQSALFREFTPEQQYLLKILAFSWPAPLTRMQLREKVQDKGDAHIVPVDTTLDELTSHKHHPMKYHEASQAFSLAHDLFAEYILRNESGEEERQVAMFQSMIDNARRVYDVTRSGLAESVLDAMWPFRERLIWKASAIPIVVASEATVVGHADRWAAWFLSVKDATIRLAAANAIRGRVSKRLWDLLSALQGDPDEALRQAVESALGRSSTPPTAEDEWDWGHSAH